MIEVLPTSDTEYMESVLAKPGIWKRVAVWKCEMMSAASAVRRPECHYIEVRDGAERRGFFIFEPITPVVWCIHCVLLTIGSRSIEAGIKAMQLVAKMEPVQTFVSYSPPQNKAAMRLAERVVNRSPELKPLLGLPDDWEAYSLPCQQF